MRVRDSYPSRWLTLAAALVFLVLAGSGYSFSLVSGALKDRLDLTQAQITTIGAVGGVGANTFGIVAGIFSNRLGPQISVLIGTLMMLIGWVVLTLITTQFIAIKSWIIVCFVYFVVRLGICFLGNSSIALCVQNFPQKDRGKTLGLGKGYLGLATAFFAVFKSDVANGDVDTFMYSLIVFIPVVSLFSVWFIVLLPPKLASRYVPNEIQSIGLWYIAAVTLANYLVAITIIQEMYSLHIVIRYILFGVMLCLWLCPWILAVFFHGNRRIECKQFDDEHHGMSSASLNMDLLPNLLEQSESRNVSFVEVELMESDTVNVGMPDIFRYWQLYSMYIVLGIVTGSAICFLNNAPQIIESASSDAEREIENSEMNTALVAFTSIGQFIGRICGGFLIDCVPSLHCSVWMIAPAVLMTLTQTVLFLNATNLEVIQGAGFLIGIAFGWIFTVIVVCVSNLWGTRYLTGNFALFNSAASLGNVLFSLVMSASIYQHFAMMEGNGTKCYGPDCYRWTFLICAGCSCIASILSILHWRLTPKNP